MQTDGLVQIDNLGHPINECSSSKISLLADENARLRKEKDELLKVVAYLSGKLNELSVYEGH